MVIVLHTDNIGYHEDRDTPTLKCIHESLFPSGLGTIFVFNCFRLKVNFIHAIGFVGIKGCEASL